MSFQVALLSDCRFQLAASNGISNSLPKADDTDAFTAALFANVHRQDILSILDTVRTKLSLRLEFCDDGGQGFHATPSKPLGVTVWACASTIDVKGGLRQTAVALPIFPPPYAVFVF